MTQKTLDHYHTASEPLCHCTNPSSTPRASPSGVIKYIGGASMGAGVWLGLDLRNRAGRHDGAVDGRR